MGCALLRLLKGRQQRHHSSEHPQVVITYCFEKYSLLFVVPTFRLNLNSLLDADLASATVVISSGLLIESLSPFQFIVMALIEIPLSASNKWVGTDLLEVIRCLR